MSNVNIQIAAALVVEANEITEQICGGFYNPDSCETCRVVERLRESARHYRKLAVSAPP